MLSLLLVLGCTLLGCTLYPERQPKAFTDATGGEGVERSFWQAIEKKQWKAIDAHLAPNFVYVTPAGRVDRAAALSEIQQLRLDEYSLGDLTTEMNGQTFVVSYSVTLRGTAGGQPLPNKPQRRVSVWQKQKASWVLISHTVLPSDHA
jgi:hypothetical protein